jgi:predicted RNA-binding Zn ribbon-like protein
VTKQFQLVAGHPVLDLVNTLDWRFRESGPEELLCTYDDVLRFSEQSKVLTRSQTRRLRGGVRPAALRAVKEFRETMARILYTVMDEKMPPADAIKKLNHYVQEAQSARRLRWGLTRFDVSWTESDTEELPVWLLAQSAFELLTSDGMERVRACANAECRWLFLDTSKNHSRRWCDMAVCGNRMKARRFKDAHGA